MSKTNYRFETLQLHVGQEAPDSATGARAVPIYATTSFVFENAAQAAGRFALTEGGNIYTRLMNPTSDVFEQRIAALEGGAAALATASGSAAITYAVRNIARAGDHIVSASNLYGGTYNLFANTLAESGIETTFVDAADPQNFARAIRPNTKLVYLESLGNPHSDVVDVEAVSAAAHAAGIPVIVDNTFATPYLCRPFEYGADIIVHSTTKYMEGQAVQMGGVVVDSGRFDWNSGKFPEFTDPDPSYHGTVYTKAFGKAAFIVKARVQIMRDLGCCQTPQGAFYLNMGLQTLPVRMDRHCRNAEQVAAFLEGHPEIEFVNYPGLASSPDHALAEKYLPKGCAGVISFSLRGGRDAGARFIDSLRLCTLEVHVADIRTCVLHPASSTHRQLTDEQLVECGITPGLVRLSVGLEDAGDIIEDLRQALGKA